EVALEHLGRLLDRPASEGSDRLAQLLRTPDAVALPERHRARHAGGGGNDHAVSPDLLDAPCRCAEQERLAGARLVHHLLVELADAPAVRERDGEEASVGDRARIGDGELAGSPSCITRATTAHSSRSARNLGKIRPRETSPTLWPARPMRCRPRETDLGDSTWRTRSTAPMSMPSSSDEVATRQGSRPDFSS